MKFSRTILFLSLLGLLPGNGCTDDPPNAVGVGLIPSKDGLNIVSYDTTAISSSTYLSRISGSSTVLMLGKYQDNESRALIYFAIDSTHFPGTRIDSATLNFRFSYKFKDSIGTLGFELHNMRTDWSEGTYTWDSLTTSSYSDTILGTYTISLHPGDSTLSIRLDTNAVRNWTHNGLSSLVLLPTNASTIILGLWSINSVPAYQPKLSIAYHDSVDSTHVDSVFTTKKVFVANSSLPAASQHFFAQASVVNRSILRFDVSGVPKNASITEAILQLSYDPAFSVRGYSSDSTVMAQMALDDSAKPALGGLYGFGTFKNSTTVTFPVTSIVQQWVTRHVNHGIIVKVYGEFVNFDRYAFYDETVSPALRPTLTVKYSVVP